MFLTRISLSHRYELFYCFDSFFSNDIFLKKHFYGHIGSLYALFGDLVVHSIDPPDVLGGLLWLLLFGFMES